MENTPNVENENLESEEANSGSAVANQDDSSANNNDEGLNYDIQQSDQIDLYADVDANDPAESSHVHLDTQASTNNHNENNNENELNLHEDGVIVSVSATDEPGLYDDVMAAPTPTNISNDMVMMQQQQHQLHEDMNTNRNDNGDEFYQDQSKHSGDDSNRQSQGTSGSSTQNSGYARRVSCYIGNLTWWTNDKHLTEVIQNQLEISDLIDIKFYENKINGQSKGFASVIVGSDTSFRTLMDKLPKIPINGQEPAVTPFNRFYYNQFEDQARKDMPSMGNNGNNGGGYNDNYNDNGGNSYNSYGSNNGYNNNGYRMNNQGGNGGMASNMNNGNNMPFNRDNMSMLHFIYFNLFKSMYYYDFKSDNLKDFFEPRCFFLF
jgi:hypothetical protein